MNDVTAARPHTRRWYEAVPEEELARLRKAGFGSPGAQGSRPCLIIIDVLLSFLGARPGEDPGEQHYSAGCEPFGWGTLPRIREVLHAARGAGIPRVFCKGWPEAATVVGGSVKLTHERSEAARTHSADFPAELRPQPDEFVLQKTKASALFQTPLLTFMHQNRVDSVILTGATTSGCVRATAVDAASYGFGVTVVEDACFDRSEYTHASNLFDIQMKYGDVV